MNNTTLTKEAIISIVSQRFETNPRIKSLFDIENSSYKENVQNLITYCYCIANRLNGIFVASNQKTIIFFYIKKNYHQTFGDIMRYIRVIFGVKLSKFWSNIKREKMIKKSRLSFPNYIYVWFLAQEKGYGRIDGLIEVQKFLFREAQNKGIPILLETSNEDVVKLYLRASFIIYNVITFNDEKIYFLHAGQETLANFWDNQKKLPRV